jgi:hypothetical protein
LFFYNKAGVTHLYNCQVQAVGKYCPSQEGKGNHPKEDDPAKFGGKVVRYLFISKKFDLGYGLRFGFSSVNEMVSYFRAPILEACQVAAPGSSMHRTLCLYVESNMKLPTKHKR